MITLDTQQHCAVSLCAVTKAFRTVLNPGLVPGSESTRASHKRSLFMFHMALALKKRDRKKLLFACWPFGKRTKCSAICCCVVPMICATCLSNFDLFISLLFLFFLNTLVFIKVKPSTSTMISNGFQTNASVVSPLCRFFLYTVGAETIKSLSRHLSSPSCSLSVISYLSSPSPSN